MRKSLQGSLQEWQALGALNYEMETAALFIVAQSFGLQAASICGVVAKRTDSDWLRRRIFTNWLRKDFRQ